MHTSPLKLNLNALYHRGSVLGPLLFILYTAELAGIAVKLNVNVHSYADDTQVLLHCKPDAVSCGVVLLEQCIDEIEQWMAANRLKLNADKTELLWTGTCSRLKKLTPMHPSIAVKPADSARLLAVLISPDLTLKQVETTHVISRVCFYQLRQIRSVRRSSDDESTATLVHAFVASRVEYVLLCLFGSPKTVTDKLQRVLNAAAPVVTNTRKYDRGLHHTK